MGNGSKNRSFGWFGQPISRRAIQRELRQKNRNPQKQENKPTKSGKSIPMKIHSKKISCGETGDSDHHEKASVSNSVLVRFYDIQYSAMMANPSRILSKK